MVDGEILLRDGAFLKADKAEVRARIRESLSRALTDGERERIALSRELTPRVQRWFAGWELEDGDGYYAYNLR